MNRTIRIAVFIVVFLMGLTAFPSLLSAQDTTTVESSWGDANTIECVGNLPWAGFMLGCILLGSALVLLIMIVSVGFFDWLKYTQFGQWYKHTTLIDISHEQKKKASTVWKFIKKGIAILGFVLLGAMGCWMTWGFIKVIICLSQN